MSCGADTTANTLLTSLLQGKDFSLPDVDLTDAQFQIPNGTGPLYGNVSALTNEDLTTRVVGGSGVFDALMDSISVHLKKEYEANRITGQEYTKAYIGIVGGALQTAASYLLGRDQAYWQAVLAQQQARSAEIAVVTARIMLETAKAQLAIATTQALNAEAEFGLTKVKIATEDQQYCLLKAQTTAADYTNINLLPAQKAQLLAQTEQVEAQTASVAYNTAQILPTQKAGLLLDNTAKDYQNDHILPAQKNLIEEQVEVQRAQTLNTRTDGATITGSVGKQKDLYTQQITSYQRDAEVKAAKLFTDAWITMKTIDEGLLAPDNFNNASLNSILADIKNKNSIG